MEVEAQRIYKRKVIDEILKYISDQGVIILYGARQVGKTYILYWLRDYLKEMGEEVFYLDLEDRRYLNILNRDGPEGLKNILLDYGVNLEKRVYVLIDEIQYLKNPTNFLKLLSDHYLDFKAVVSGSSTFEIRKKMEKALVGRAVVFEIFGLSFEEFLIFKGYNKPIEPVLTEVKEEELKTLFTEFVLYGSYPRVPLMSEKEKKERYLWQIIDTYLKKDIRDLAEIKEVEKFNKLLEILASQSGKLLNMEELSNTCRLAKQTVEKYLFILENTFVIRLVKPFYNNLRSELFKTPKVYFYDSGLANLLWLKVISPEILGEIFETAIFSELVKCFGRDSINFWRTKDRKEIDFIVRYRDKVIPIESKVNFGEFGNNRVMEYFAGKYKIRDYYFVGLKNQKPEEKSYIYPWQMGRIVKSF